MAGMRSIRRAVVSGGAGFLGSHLCDRLISHGIDVLCLDNFLTGKPANVAHLQDNPHFRLLRCDVTDFVHVPGDVDLVLHFASPASPADYLRMPIETLQVGSLGTLHLLGMAVERNARFVLASTSEVYGDPLVHPQQEDYWGNVNPIGPRGVYDEAKRFSEALTTAYRLSRNADTGIVRIFNTFGPRMRPDDGRAVPTFMAQALTGQDITVAGTGAQTRSISYVDDTVDGILRLAMSDVSDPVNIGNPHEVTMLELAEIIRDLAGSESRITFVPLPQDDPRVRRPDTTRASQLLGWSPQVDVKDGLRETMNWVIQQSQAEA